MPKNFPVDEFDSVDAVGGRHRAKASAGTRLLSFTRYASVTVALSVAGILTLDTISGTSHFSDVLSGTTVATQSDFNANGLGVTVIDTTSRAGLASKVAHSLFAAGWNVLSATNSVLLAKITDANPAGTPAPAPTPLTSASAATGSEASVGKTVVYVTTAQAQSAANQLLKTLGTYEVVQSNQYADPITVVLATDYK